jgi:drug/metabolite transporter (DMT)-like permease
VVGLLLWNFGVAKTNLVIASLYTNLVPIVAVAVLAVGGAAPTVAQIAGGALVVGGVAWCEWRLLRLRAVAAAKQPE